MAIKCKKLCTYTDRLAQKLWVVQVPGSKEIGGFIPKEKPYYEHE